MDLITRRENLLGLIAGEEGAVLPEPPYITREEKLLYAIYLNGGGGGGTSPFYPAGNTAFADLPELSADILGAMYNITDAFTTDSRFNEGAGVDYPAGTNVVVVNTGTSESPVLKFDTFAGAYVVDNALSDASENPVQNKVIKSALDSKATHADVAALINDTTAAQNKAYSSAKVEEKVAGEEITTTATGSDLTLSTAEGSLNALTVYGKSEIVDNAIVSAGEGWSTVDLGTLDWTYISGDNSRFQVRVDYIHPPQSTLSKASIVCAKYTTQSSDDVYYHRYDKSIGYHLSLLYLCVYDTDYTDAATFKSAMSGVMLCYQLADPTQGNCIAVKTDDGTGVNGTMAVFETGTPLRGIPDTSVRDVMEWDGTSGEVTKKCVKVRLADLTWGESASHPGGFSTNVSNMLSGSYNLISTYPFNNQIGFSWASFDNYSDNTMFRSSANKYNYIKSTSYAGNVESFVASLGDAEMVYELATPVTTPLTTAENASLASLRTFAPTTHAQNNAGAEMTVDAYAGTANGKAIADLKSELKITQSDTLTLTTAGWSNNAQTVSYAHDTAKRNVIDVDPASVEEWANCGVLATVETSSGITFTCKAVPTNALNFKVTSMGV